jgi:hypothetical protein
MEPRVMELALTGFGAAPTPATVEVVTLSPADRFKRATGAVGAGLIAAALALPIPLVHFVLVPAALVLGFGSGIARFGQREIFRGGRGHCPFCSTEQKLSLVGGFTCLRQCTARPVSENYC